MRGCITVITVITVIILMLQGNYWCLRNLRGTFELFSYEEA
jgi:hypothetical protein